MFRNVIIVDDEILEAFCLRDAVEWHSYGLTVKECFENAAAALSYIENSAVDVIISDIRMPHIDGIEFCRRVRDEYPEITFIFLSAYRDFEYAKTAIEYRVFDYITKPIDILQLEKTCELLSGHFKSISSDYPTIPLETLHYQQILINYITDSVTFAELSSVLSEKGLVNTFVRKKLAYVSIYFNDLFDFLTENPLYSIDKVYAHVLDAISVDDVLTVPLIYTANGFKAVALSLNDDVFDDRLSQLCSNATKKCRQETGLAVYAELLKKYSNLHLFKENSDISGLVVRPSSKTDNNIIASARQYIEEHYKKDISLFEISSHVCITPYHFCRIFKKETGTNFTSYLNIVRINHAKQLLLETEFNNEEICDLVGINSVNYFYQLFKSVTGTTPHKFRKNKNQED